MNRNTFIITFTLLALASGHVGCSPAKEDQPPKPKVTASGEPDAGSRGGKTAMALPVIGPAPAWRLTDLNGAPVSSDQFKGKVVVVDFWATWCPPCVKEIPGYVELAQKYAKDLVIVGISLDQGGPEVVKQFAAKHRVQYPLVMGDEKVVAAFGGVEAIPTTFLIDRQGQIRDRKVGAEETASYEKKIASLLN